MNLKEIYLHIEKNMIPIQNCADYEIGLSKEDYVTLKTELQIIDEVRFMQSKPEPPQYKIKESGYGFFAYYPAEYEYDFHDPEYLDKLDKWMKQKDFRRDAKTTGKKDIILMTSKGRCFIKIKE